VDAEENIERIIKNVLATLYFEGLKPRDEVIESSKKILQEEITGETARDRIISRISNKSEMAEKDKNESDRQSIQCYSDSYVYKNKFDIKNGDLLDQVEADLTTLRLIELHMNPKKSIFNTNALKMMHNHIFQDLYPFAGEIRREEISKGNTLFCKSEFIESSLEKLFQDIETKGFFKKKSDDAFIEGIVFLMGELNIIHPFREGNGRCIRAFVGNIALNNDYCIHWSKTNADEILNAVINTVNFEYSQLRSIVKSIISPRRCFNE